MSQLNEHQQFLRSANTAPSSSSIAWASRRRRISDAAWRAGFNRHLKKHGMSRQSLGPDYVRRLELAGLPVDTLDDVLARIRHRGDWVRVWEQEGDRYAEESAHEQACAAYYMAQRWLFIDQDTRSRMYARATHHYSLMSHPVALERVDFDVNGRRVAGILQVPHNALPAPLMVLFPGLTATKEELHPLTVGLLDQGIAVCRVDLPGFGETSGYIDEAPTILSTGVISHLMQDSRVDAGRVYAAGFCTGGMYAATASYTLDLAGVTMISAPVKPFRYFTQLPKAMLDALEVAMGTSSMVESYENLRALDLVSLPKVTAPLTAIYGGRDDMIPPSELTIIEEYTPHLVDIHFFKEQPHACVGRMPEIIEILVGQVVGEAAAA